MDLINAICKKDLASVRRLLATPSGKAAVNELDKNGLASAHLAAKIGNADILEALHEAVADFDLKSDASYSKGRLRSGTPLHYAAVSGHLPAIDFLLDRGVDIDEEGILFDKYFPENPLYATVLMVAVDAGQYKAALHHLEHGADPGATDTDDSSILHYCVASDRLNDPETVNPDLLAVMRAAVEKGADIDASTHEFKLELYEYTMEAYSALHLAAALNRPLLIKFLVGAGATVDLQDGIYWTALHHAAESGSFEAFQALLETGADVSALDEDGRCVLHRGGPDGNSEGRLKIFEVALAVGMNINRTGWSIHSPLMTMVTANFPAGVRFFIDHGANLNARSRYGATAVRLAACQPHPEILKMLIAADADLTARKYGTVLKAVAKQYAEVKRDAPLNVNNAKLDDFQKVMAILVAAGERDWDLIPTPCRYLHRALPEVMQEASVELGGLFQRLVPHIQDEIRSALLLLNRFCLRGARDLQLPLLQVLMELQDL